MDLDKDTIIDNFLGLNYELNLKERKLFITYSEKKSLKNIGKVVELLTQKSDLNALEIASFSLYIEHININNIKLTA